MKKTKILVIQETDWIERGPHQHHHIFERLNKKPEYDVRVIDFPLIWDPIKRNKFSIYDRSKEIIVDAKVNDTKVKVYRNGYLNIKPFNYFSIYFQRPLIKEQLKKFRPNYVICMASLLNVNYVRKLCNKQNIPFIYYLLEKYYSLIPTKILKKYAKYKEIEAVKNSDLNLVINQGLKDYCIKIGADENKIKIIPAGIDFKKYNSSIVATDLKEKFGIKQNDTVLFFMGWIYEFSGMKEIAEELVKKNDKNLKLIIVGEGDLYDYLQNFKVEKGLEDRLILTGKVPFEDIPRYLSIADICLLPAYKNEIMENIVPIKMYEYMAMGKPVIATELSGIMEEFGKKNGVMYIKKSRDAINISLSLIKENKIKEEGLKAKNFIENHTWDKIIKNFYNTLKENI